MQISTEVKTGGQEQAETPLGEFIYIPLNQIAVETQIRSSIDTDSEAFKAMLDSIRRRGVLEPVLVGWRGVEFVLISGERRYKACQVLGLPAIPARILENVEVAEEALSIQLMENLHRENLDPVDEAGAYIRYFQLSRGELSLDEILNTFANLDIDPQRVDTESSRTATALVATTGKSIASIRRLLSLLKLPQEIQQALREGGIGLTEGYIFAAEADNPALSEIFTALLAKPVTNVELKRRLVQARKRAEGKIPVVKAEKVDGYRRSLKNIRASVQTQAGVLTAAQADLLLTDLRELTAFIERLRAEAQIAAAAQGVQL